MIELLRESQCREGEMVRLLARFVRCESPSRDKTTVDRFGKIVAAEFRKCGARIRFWRQRSRGDHLRVEFWTGKERPAGQILVLGHLDTVYPVGTLRRMPFRIAAGRAWGPGTFDMKGGIVLALIALDALRAARTLPGKRLVFLWTSDEEIGSETSRRIIEREARRSDTVLVLEPSLGPGGRLKTVRKGVGSAEIIVTGRSAHAGVDPERGVNAVEELALQIARLRRLHQPHRGITVQATVIEGGTTSNVIPASARAELDIRFPRLADERALRQQLLSMRPILHGARVEIRLGSFRPPLERTAAVRALFRQAQSLARELGVHLGEASTGGGSDGNFTSALGIPTLDGLGAVGDAPHSPREHVVIGKLPQRAALLAGLLATL
jgi:glutamate carboxypeptidase